MTYVLFLLSYKPYGYVHPTLSFFLNAVISRVVSCNDVPWSVIKSFFGLSAALQIFQSRILIAMTQSCIEVSVKENLSSVLYER